MLEFIQNQILFYVSLAFVLFVPGYFLLLAIYGKSKIISNLERFVISFGLSVVVVDFIFFTFDKLGILITRPSSIVGILAFVLACYAIYKIKHRNTEIKNEESKELFNFSKNQFILILLLLSLAFFIKTSYLSGTVLPSSTDMGHHMYWAKVMTESHILPTYEGMPDFIIGEHVIFGIIGILSGASFFSAFPPLVLYLINIFSLLAVFILIIRIFENKNIAILSLFFLGVLYAVSSPQAKFVSGGVVGNILGNFLMPLSFYFYYRAFADLGKTNSDNNSRAFFATGVFLTAGLFYTHHLTAFIFIFVTIFLAILFILTNFKELGIVFRKALKIIFSPQSISVLVLCLIFFFWVFTPNYAQKSAVDTAVGVPSKSTRLGLSFDNIRGTVGEARIALGIIGLVLLGINYKRKNFGYAIIVSWAVMIWLMSTKPQWLFIDLPSSRIGNYLTYPLAILASYGFYYVFKNYSKNFLIKASFILIFSFAVINGISELNSSFNNKNNSAELVQTFHSTEYVAKNTSNSDIILKDHNYISGDSWMKLLFGRGYKYPLSRGYFKRYEDPINPREQCTLLMISNPNSSEAKNCFSETGTNYIIVDPLYDSAQFKKLANFNEVYAGENIALFFKKK